MFDIEVQENEIKNLNSSNELNFSFGPIRITLDKQGNIDISGYKSLTLDGEELDIVNKENVYINGKEIHLNLPLEKK